MFNDGFNNDFDSFSFGEYREHEDPQYYIDISILPCVGKEKN